MEPTTETEESPHAMTAPRPKCDVCGRVTVLDEANMCVACAPVAHTCSEGVPCEFDRLVRFEAFNDRIKSLRLCKHHATIRDEGLAAAEDAYRLRHPPPPAAVSDCFAVLGLNDDATEIGVRRAWKQLAKEHHPDQGGDADKFVRIERAYREALELVGVSQ